METKCSVVSCTNVNNSAKVFYKFPEASDLCVLWAQNTGNPQLLEEYSKDKNITENYICSDHFLDIDFEVFGYPRSGLKSDAVPFIKYVDTSQLPNIDVKHDDAGNEEDPFDTLPLCTILHEEAYKTEEISLPEETNTKSLKKTERKSKKLNQKTKQKTNNNETEIKKKRKKKTKKQSVKKEHNTTEGSELQESRRGGRRKRTDLTPEQKKELTKMRKRLSARARHQNESEIQKAVRRKRDALRASIVRSKETPEQTMERRMKDAIRAAERRKTETPQEREERLRKDRERVAFKRMEIILSETPEEREVRLGKERDRKKEKRLIKNISKTVQHFIADSLMNEMINLEDSREKIQNPVDMDIKIEDHHIDVKDLNLNIKTDDEHVQKNS